MRLSNAVFVLVLLIGGTTVAFAQSTNRTKDWRVTEAYVVLVKEKAKARGDLYEAEHQWTAETPEVKVARLRLALFDREIKKLSRTNTRSALKYSAAYGELIVAKIQTETELFELRQKFTPEYFSVKKKEVELASLNSDLKRINKIP